MIVFLDPSDTIVPQNPEWKKSLGKYPKLRDISNRKFDFTRVVTQKSWEGTGDNKFDLVGYEPNNGNNQIKRFENAISKPLQPNYKWEKPNKLNQNVVSPIVKMNMNIFQSEYTLDDVSNKTLQEVEKSIKETLDNLFILVPISNKYDLSDKIKEIRRELHNSTNPERIIELRDELNELEDKQSEMMIQDKNNRLDLDYEVKIVNNRIELEYCSLCDLVSLNSEGKEVEKRPYLLNKTNFTLLIEKSFKEQLGVNKLHQGLIKENLKLEDKDYNQENIKEYVYDRVYKVDNKLEQLNGVNPETKKEEVKTPSTNETVEQTETTKKEYKEVNHNSKADKQLEELLDENELRKEDNIEVEEIDEDLLVDNEFIKEEVKEELQKEQTKPQSKPMPKDHVRNVLGDDFFAEMVGDLKNNEGEQKRLSDEIDKELEELKRRKMVALSMENQNKNTKILMERYEVSVNQNLELNNKNAELEGWLREEEKKVTQLTSDIEQYSQTLNEKMGEISDLTEERDNLNKEVEGLNSEVEDLTNDNNELTSKNETLTKEKEDLTTKVGSLEDRVKELEGLLQDRNNTIETQNNTINTQTETIGKLESQNETLTKSLEDITNKFNTTNKQLEDTLSKLDKEVEGRSKDKDLFEEVIRGIKKSNELLEEQNRNQRSDIEEFKKTLTSLNTKNEELLTTVSRNEELIDNLEKENVSVTNQLKENEKVHKLEIENLKDKVEVKEETISKLKKENEDLKLKKQKTKNDRVEKLQSKVSEGIRENNPSKVLKGMTTLNDIIPEEDNDNGLNNK